MPTTTLALAAPATVRLTNAQAGRRDASPEVITLDLAARLGVLRQDGDEVRTDALCGHLVLDRSARLLPCGDILCAYPDCDNEHLKHCGDCLAVVLSS